MRICTGGPQPEPNKSIFSRIENNLLSRVEIKRERERDKERERASPTFILFFIFSVNLVLHLSMNYNCSVKRANTFSLKRPVHQYF